MGVSRRAPGQRLRRSRRNQELEQLAESDPDKYAEMVELRRLSPQQFRKELARLIKRGALVKGRTYRLHPDDIAALDTDDLQGLMRSIQERADAGELDFRRLTGLAQEEKLSRARPDLMALLSKLAKEAVEAEGRAPV